MFTDPLTVTYDSEEKSLPRLSPTNDGAKYATADGEFEISVSHSPAEDSGIRHSITLRRIPPDPTPTDPFDHWERLPNGVTLSFDRNSFGYKSGEDLPLLRAALETLVDSEGFLQRLLGGES